MRSMIARLFGSAAPGSVAWPIGLLSPLSYVPDSIAGLVTEDPSPGRQCRSSLSAGTGSTTMPSSSSARVSRALA